MADNVVGQAKVKLGLDAEQFKKGIKERQPDIKIALKMSHEGRFRLTHFLCRFLD